MEHLAAGAPLPDLPYIPYIPYIRYKSLTLVIGSGGVEPHGVHNSGGHVACSCGAACRRMKRSMHPRVRLGQRMCTRDRTS